MCSCFPPAKWRARIKANYNNDVEVLLSRYFHSNYGICSTDQMKNCQELIIVSKIDTHVSKGISRLVKLFLQVLQNGFKSDTSSNYTESRWKTSTTTKTKISRFQPLHVDHSRWFFQSKNSELLNIRRS